jgi:hypothetical protein
MSLDDGNLRAADVIPGFEAENEVERRLAEDPALLEGLAWGRPRPGHPEGAVGAHVSDLLRTIDAWDETGERRSELRLISLVHDAMKCKVKEWLPRTGENHHAMRARRFAEAYTDDERVLATIELHDRPYGIWRASRQRGGDPSDRLAAMSERIPDLELFLRFVELDGSTEGKNPEPVEWVRSELAQRTGEG